MREGSHPGGEGGRVKGRVPLTGHAGDAEDVRGGGREGLEHVGRADEGGREREGEGPAHRARWRCRGCERRRRGRPRARRPGR